MNKIQKNNQLRWLWVSIAIIALDQISKYFIATNFNFYKVIEIFPFLNLILSHNTGAAFGLLCLAGGWQRWFFAAIALVVSIVIAYSLSRMPRDKNWFACALALILGGALGNLYDRAVLGYVIDFIDFHVGNWHFATFNIADSAICIGVAMWLINEVFLTPRKSGK